MGSRMVTRPLLSILPPFISAYPSPRAEPFETTVSLRPAWRAPAAVGHFSALPPAFLSRHVFSALLPDELTPITQLPPSRRPSFPSFKGTNWLDPQGTPFSTVFLLMVDDSLQSTTRDASTYTPPFSALPRVRVADLVESACHRSSGFALFPLFISARG